MAHYSIKHLNVGVRRVVVIRYGPGEPMTGEIQRDDSEFISEKFDPGFPRVQRGTGTVQQHNYFPLSITFVAIMDSRSIFHHQELGRRTCISGVYNINWNRLFIHKYHGDDHQESQDISQIL